MLNKNKDLIISVIVMLLWGLLFPMVKLGYSVFGVNTIGDILTFAGFRFLFCGFIISLFSFIKYRQNFKGLKNNLPMVLLSGVFAIILHYSFTYVGLSITEGSKTAILKQLGAVFYICFSSFFFKEDKINAKKIIGLVLGFCGIIAINIGSGGFKFHFGDVLIILASFCTVFSNITSKKVFRFVEPIVSTGVSQFFGGAVLLIAGVIMDGKVSAVVPTNINQVGVFAVIVLCSVISYCLWFITVQKQELSKLFIIKFLEPLFASAWSLILLNEDIFKFKYLAAFILISGGIAIANSKKPKIV